MSQPASLPLTSRVGLGEDRRNDTSLAALVPGMQEGHSPTSVQWFPSGALLGLGVQPPVLRATLREDQKSKTQSGKEESRKKEGDRRI